jgi:hypothetical protein
MLGTLLDTKPAPHWRDDPRLKEPAAAVADAEAAEADATARRDRASARVLALDAELAAAKDMKQADRLEDAREAAVEEEAKAARDIERARRVAERARKSHEPVETTVLRDYAVARRRDLGERAAAIIATLETLKAQAIDLDDFVREIRATVPEATFPEGAVGNLCGLLRRDVAGDLDTVIGAPGVLARLVTGRRGQSVEIAINQLRALGLP